MTIKVPHRLYLTEDQIPQQWYNLRADMKEQAAPMINPATGKPAVVEDLYPVFCKELAQQEMDNETRYFAECILGMHENTVNTPEDSMKTIALVHSEIRSANGKGEKTKV